MGFEQEAYYYGKWLETFVIWYMLFIWYVMYIYGLILILNFVICSGICNLALLPL